MATLQVKFNIVYSARAKLEAELNNNYSEIRKELGKQDRRS